MRILRHGPAPRDTAIAIGSFDGVHRGHAAILERVRDEARARALACGVVTFDPLPREFFRSAEAPARISSIGERLADFARLELEVAFVERFDARFAALTADEFEQRVRDKYRARWVMVGEDFRYGARRVGDVERLARAGARLGFEVHAHPAVVVGGERVSSTAVREALAAGDLEHAERLLGRPYAICGRVVHGAKRGRGMGFPTANVRLARSRPALSGIFAVKCDVAATRGLEGVASLGRNPAVADDGPATLEAFLFDFQGDLYGRRLSIEFVKKLRDEAPFASIDELVAQIRRDCDIARELFRARRTR